MPKLRLSIVTRLTLLVFAVGTPLSGILAWSILSQFETDVAAAELRATTIIDAIAARTEATLDQTRIMLMGIAKRPKVQAMDRTHCDPFLVDLRQTLPQYANFNVMNRQWEFVCSAVFHDPDVVVATKYPEVYEKMMLIDDVVLSPPIQGQLTGKWVVFAAYPVKDAENEVLGAVTAPIDLTVLAPVISDSALPENTIIRIVDSSGNIVTSYPDTDRIGKYDRGIAAVAGTGKSGITTTRSFDDIERVYAYTRVRDSDWVAIAGLPTAWAFADFRRVRDQLVFLLLVALALAASLTFIIARQIARPIRELQQDAEILANGHHAHRSRVVSRDEIGQLAATFNHMAQTLETDEAEHMQAELSIRHLNRVYAVLSQINTLIVRVQDHDELFREACRVAAEAGGFRMSMIVTVDRDTRQLESVVSSGKDEDLLEAIKEYLSSKQGMEKSMVAMALNEKKAIISNNTQNDPRLVFGKYYSDAGVNSLVVLPLIVSDVAAGVLALYASEAEFFQDDEIKLLSELAGDISFAIDHIEKRERLNFLAYYDELTGLANRSLALERITQYMHNAARGGHKLAIGLIDLERFKNINDSLGRTIGDQLLKQVAEWLKEKVADASLLARIDADHFAIVLPVVRSDGNLAKLTESLIAAFLEHPFQLNKAVFRIGIKLGLAVYPDDGDNADTLFNQAEAALKKAKASGDRYLFYTQKMTESVADKLAMENQLRQAIDKEEFVLHYQPKVDLVSGKVSGAEALIRWNDPRTGLVPPNEFIPILEETGMIYEVGRWALHKTIEDILRWRTAGLAVVRIAVNVSPLQLRHPGFSSEIEQAIAIDPTVAASLELEITESLIMADIEHCISSLHAIRAMGVTIAIDDFGTGFSSLNYLAKLPVDTLKVDRSFITAMETPEGLELVSTIITVAHALKLKVVAEGVETDAQLQQIRALNCEEMQGYLFSKPVPVETFETRFLVPIPAS
jgi:diguanylate cyclase (GGDEF)-like protein